MASSKRWETMHLNVGRVHESIEESLKMLKMRGTTVYQGYYVKRRVPHSIFSLLVAKHSRYDKIEVYTTQKLIDRLFEKSLDALKTKYADEQDLDYFDLAVCAAMLSASGKIANRIASIPIPQLHKTIEVGSRLEAQIRARRVLWHWLQTGTIDVCRDETDLITASVYRRPKWIVSTLRAIEANRPKTAGNAIAHTIAAHLNRERENSFEPWLYRIVSPLGTALYHLTIRNGLDRNVLNATTFKYSFYDLSKSLRQQKKTCRVSDFVLTRESLDPDCIIHPEGKTSKNKSVGHAKSKSNTKTRNSIFVPDDAPTLHAAVQLLENGGTINIRPGQYEESQSVIIEKSLTLCGLTDDWKKTVFTCRTGPVLIVKRGEFTLRGISFFAADRYENAVEISTQTSKITQCGFSSQHKSGLCITGRGVKTEVCDSTFFDCKENGIFISDYAAATFTRCQITGTQGAAFIRANSKGTFQECQVEGSIVILDKSSGTLAECDMNDGVTVLNKSKIHCRNCKIRISHQGGTAGCSNYSSSLFQDCIIEKRFNPTLYTTDNSSSEFQRCKIIVPSKYFEFRGENSVIKLVDCETEIRNSKNKPSGKTRK